MSFTLFQYTAAFFLRTIMLIVAVSLFLTVEGYSDTVVVPASGGDNLCVGGDYITLGDITVREGNSSDFERGRTNREFILQVTSSNFEFKPGTGTVTPQLLSLALAINSITVTATEIIVNYDMANNDLSMDGFVISGIQVRAVNSADVGHIVVKDHANRAKQHKNESPDNVSHGLLVGVTGVITPPVLNSSDADNIICAGDLIIFTASAGTTANYDFLVDNVSVQNSTSSTYTTSSLTHGQTVKVKLIPAFGCASATSNSIVTNVISFPSVTLSSSDNNICSGKSVTFTASSATATSFEFFVDGISKQNGASVTYTTTGLTHGQAVRVKATTNSGCSSTSVDIITTVNPSPTVTLISSDGDHVICAGDTVTFTATSATATSFEFFVDGISQQNGSSDTYTTSVLTHGQAVTVRASENSCSMVSSPITTSVTALPTVVLTSSDPDHVICLGDAVTFTAASATAVNYKFYVDGSLEQDGASPVFITTTLTTLQRVKVRVTTASNCSTESSDITTTVNPSPTVTLISSDGDHVICAGDTVTFTATSATATSYEFFVDGISKQNNASNTYTTTALTNGQTVTVRVKDGSSCSTMSAGITTTVNAVPFVILTSSDADQSICAGESVTFTAFTSMPISSFNFLVNGSSLQNTASATFSTASLSDTDIVTVEAATGANCNALSNAIAFSVKSLPTVSLTSSDADNVICAGETVTFTAASAAAASYEFFVDGFIVQTGVSNQYITTSLINGQTVTVKAASSAGCATASSGLTFTVNPLPTVSLVGDKSVICAGDTITFTASSSTATSFEFFVDGVSVQTGASNTYTTSSLTNGQKISVKATDVNTCTAVSNNVTAIINTLPLISLSSSDADNIICLGETVTFTASSATGTYFQFFVDGISVQNSTSNKYSTNSLTNGQVVTVRSITSNGCTSNSSPGSMVTVNPLPVVSLASSDSDRIICPGESITFTASSATAISFEFFVDGISVQTGASNTYTTSSLTNGQKISVKATDGNGCSALSPGITIQVFPLVVILSSSDPNNAICSGETVTFSASSATATSFEFFVDGVSKQSGASNTYITSSLTNGQTVIVEATTASGCSAFSGGITTIVNIIPVINLVSSDTDHVICAGETVTLTATAPTATNYEFFVDGISVQNSATNLYITSSLTNGQIVTVEATTAGGCTFLHTGIIFTVNQLPSVNLVSSDSDNAICSGETVTFSASSATGITYKFFVDGISRQSSNSNQYITSTLANGQTVSVKVFDNNSCSIVSSGITTTVNQVPVVLLTSSDADNTICPGESITFTASSATATSFEFFVDGVSVQNGASNTYANSSLTNGQIITVKATTASGCATLSNGITTFVNILTAVLSSSDADNVICAGDAVTFTANAPTATNYEFFVDGVSVQNSATNLYITTNLTSGQAITVQATTASGCTDLSLGITTVVNPLPTVSLSSSDADNIICAGEQVIFTAISSTASIYEFFVDGVSVQNTTSNQYITNSLLNGQVLKVKAITATNCFVISNTIATVVNEIPVVVLNSNDADNTICPGESITFTANAPAAVNYEFLVNGISVQSTTSNVYTTNTLTHGQVVSVRVTAASSCAAISSGITISVTTLAVTLLSSDADNTICPGESITFTASSATATSFEFFVDGVSVQNGIPNTYITSSLTNGQKIHVVARIGVCSVSSNAIPVTVELMTVSLSSSDPDNRICSGTTVTFTAGSTTATSFEFFVDGVSVQNGASNTYITSSLTNGQLLSVKALSVSNCEATHTGITTYVEDISVALTSSDSDNVICSGDAVTFTAGSATATSFEFFVDGVSVQNGASNTYITSSLTNGQDVFVKVINAYTCSISSASISTTVNPLPTVVLTSSDSDNVICSGDALTFTAISATAVNYKFFVNGALVQDGATNQYSVSSLTNGQTVTVRVTTANSCSVGSSSITTTVNPSPTVVLTSSDSDNVICSGDALTFTVISATAVNYKFFVNGVLVQDGATNQYSVSSLTNGQTVTVRVTTANSCSVESSGIITTVNPLPTVTLASSDPDNVICLGDALTFTATSATAVNYKFFVNGALVQDGAFPTFTTTTLANGQAVTSKVTTADGCSVESSGIITTVNPLPTVVLTSSDSDNVICSGDAVTFTATSATAVNYKFFVNGALVQDGATNQYSVSSLTNGQTVTVRVTTANSCSVESSGIITTVNPLPTVVLTSSDSDNVICSGDVVTFTATSATAVNYKFFVNGALVQDGAFPTFTTTTLANGQAVTSKVTTADGCSVESSGIITTVNPLPTVVLTSSDSDDVICSGDALTFTATSATAVNYKFFVNGALVQDGATNQYSVSSLTNGQTVTVRVTTASACSTLSSGITTTVNPLPTVTLASSDPDNVICLGETVTFTATSATATNYEFFINGLSVQNSGSNKYITNALTNGQTVTVRVTTANSCSVESSGITTTVNPLPTVTLASSDPDNVICLGETVTFTATSATATNYEFFINGLSVQNSGSNKYITNALTNGQTVTVRVTTASTCSTISNGITTTVNPVATVNAGTDLVVCANEAITLTGSKGGAASMVTWSGGKGIFGDATSLNTTYIPDPSEIGKSVVLTLTTNDPDGSGPCVYVEDQVRITINALPNVLFSGLNPEYCIDAPEVTLTGFPVGGFFSGPGIVTGTSKFKPSDAGAGTHVIRYTYTDGNNCTNYIERSVIVHPLPIVSFAGFNNSGPGGSAIYPQDAPLINLTGFPPGGTFVGQGISGSTFSASAAGAGTYIIRYSYQDANKCMNYQEQTVVVAPLPNVGIGNIPSPFCSKDPDFILTGTPAGGTFSGPGIITNTSIFRPSSAFIGANVIRYTYTDPIIGGTNFIEKTVIVNKVPDVTFSGLNAAYCEDAPNVTLNGFPADNDGPGGVIGIFKGPGMVPGTSIFNPSAAGVGIHTITYIYTNENGCTDSTKNAVIVHALPQVTFSGLAAAYCVDAPSVKLTGFPVGGTFSGPGISGANFIPSLAGIGTHLIRYAYTNSNGCINIQEQSLVINQIPDASFTYYNVCDKDSVSFEDKTLEGLSGKIQQWEWNFGDPLSGNSNISDLQYPKHLFTGPGEYSVTLKVTSEYGCTDTKVIAITIGGIPQPDFTWSDICFGESVDFMAHTSLSVGSISSWEWNFGDGTSQVYTNASDKVTHLYPKAGKYMVTLKVTTNFACTNSISKQIYILPSVATYPYIENFEQSTGGWVEDGANVSWEWDIPSGTTINTASSGLKAWYTGSGQGYNPNEKSYVYSPCFDFTQLQKPMISIKVWDHTQKGFDGAVLQYSINGGVDWKNVGAIDEGINWYNQSAIVGNPGNQPIGQHGWSGTDSSWVEAKHDLDFLKGESSVRFRIAFGSNADNPPGQPLDGFAFDDVYIGERDKIVLLEHFTNSENTEAMEENSIIDGLMSNSGGEIITIQYHTNFPGNDPLNIINPADPSARALYYGIPQTPRTALDGYIENNKFSQWAVTDLSRRKLAAAAFSIDLDLTQIGPSSLHIAADITSKFDFNDSLFIYAAIVEKEVADAYSGAPVFRNVLRKLLPDAAGMLLSKTWSPGSTEIVEFSWEVMHIKDPAQLAVIVFVQDAATKEVYQVVLKEPGFIPEVITGVESNDQQEKFVVYPNPASSQAYISFDNGASQNGEWYVYDVLGRKVNSGKVQKGQKQVKIETAGFSQGTYLLQVSLNNKNTLYQKLIIYHNK
ncbi:PKD domain-containing protein [Rhodocytophaga rosea]|uniref:PKD domain-containing protein n=1 Tax=Rhodocytophaga rosea TaxID=2704465 RepID=A0A6C0GLJ7_9BACT|nr:PKD domain-containing protein [Rhodocytophaga rosea]QHT68895.1 PKD domain-containing protein [Rhodocytophaga rosea]